MHPFFFFHSSNSIFSAPTVAGGTYKREKTPSNSTMSLKMVCLSPSILTPPHGTERKENSLHKWCPTDFFVFVLTPPRGTGQNFSTHPRPLTSCFPLFFFSTPPLGTEQKSSTHSSIGPRPISHFPFFFPRHLVAQSRSPRHTARSVLDRFFFFFSRHLVARSRSPRRTAQTVHATMWPDKQNRTPL